MESKLHLKVITKEKKILDDEVDAVFLPCTTGEIGVLPGHRPLIALLGIGILHYLKNEEKHFIGILEGIVEVINDNIFVLADDIIYKEKINEEEEKSNLSEAEESLKILSGKEQEIAKKKIKKAQTSLQLLKNR